VRVHVIAAPNVDPGQGQPGGLFNRPGHDDDAG